VCLAEGRGRKRTIYVRGKRGEDAGGGVSLRETELAKWALGRGGEVLGKHAPDLGKKKKAKKFWSRPWKVELLPGRGKKDT